MISWSFFFSFVFPKTCAFFLCLQIYYTRALTWLTVYRSLSYICSQSLFAKWLRAKTWPNVGKTFIKLNNSAWTQNSFYRNKKNILRFWMHSVMLRMNRVRYVSIAFQFYLKCHYFQNIHKKWYKKNNLSENVSIYMIFFCVQARQGTSRQGEATQKKARQDKTKQNCARKHDTTR